MIGCGVSACAYGFRQTEDVMFRLLTNGKKSIINLITDFRTSHNPDLFSALQLVSVTREMNHTLLITFLCVSDSVIDCVHLCLIKYVYLHVSSIEQLVNQTSYTPSKSL